MDVRSAMKVPRYRWALWAATAAAAVFFVLQMGSLSRGHATTAARGFDLLDSLMSHIRNDYLEERDPLETSEGTFRGLVNSLDPLSAYLSKDLLDGYRAKPGDRETGPGFVVLKRYAAFPQVAAVFEKSPAEAAGVKLGDLLSAIGGRNTLNMSLAEVKLLLRGTDESPVELRVLRGNDTHNLSVPRSRLFPAAYTFVRTAGQPARLRIHRVEEGLAAALRRDVLPALKDRKAPLVLDLRGCQDGALDEAAKLANLFVKASDAGSFEGRGSKEQVSCPAEPELMALPLVIWTDAGTAGPAELTAGVLQELRKAKVVGFETPGLVGRTTLFPLRDASAVLLTSGVFALPSGRKLWDDGLVPDAAIPFDQLNDKTYLEKTRPLLPKL